MRIRIGLALTAVVLSLTVCACGSSGAPAAARPTPPSPIVVSAYVSSSRVQVSPARFGAGPVLVTVTNQSAHAVTLRIVRGSRVVARTGSIEPRAATQIKVDLPRGSYTLAAAPPGRRTDAQKTLPSPISAARLHVGRTRHAGGSSLLQP